MQVKVGQALKFREQTWLVSKIVENKWEEYAGCSSGDYRALYVENNVSNRLELDCVIGEFDKDDIVAFEKSEITLEQPGKDIFFIVTKRRAAKVPAEKEGENARDLSEGAPNGTEEMRIVRSGSDGSDRTNSSSADEPKGTEETERAVGS